jgi:NodT family efflux transporter outer membrane factor (OMF) lipoprotein
MNYFTKFAGSICFLLLVGCTVGPNYQKPDLATQLPTHYQQIDGSENSEATIDRWWHTFNDAAINQLVDMALARNLDIASSDANIRQARAQISIINSASLPQINAVGRIGRDRISKNGEFLSNIPLPNPQVNFTDYRAEFDTSWEIDLFGHNRRQAEAAQARLTSIEHQREEVELRVAAEVVRNVIDYRAWMLRSKNAQTMLEESQEILALANLQQQAGLFSTSEVMNAEIAVHQSAAAIPSLQSAATASLMALTVLSDQTQEQVVAVLQTHSTIPTVPKNIVALGLPSDLLLRRPDLRIAERELAATTADIGVAVAEQYPQLTLVANGGLDSVTPGKFTQLASTFWNLGPQLSIPLFAGGRLAAQVQSREAKRDAALAQYRQAVLTAFADTETAIIRYQREQQRLEQIELAFEAQHRQLEWADQRYQVGETNFVNVLQTRQQLAQIHDQQLASRQALAENLVVLFKSLGGSSRGRVD